MTNELEIIDDIWVVEHACGKGGMGSVFRCHNRDAPRILAAIKLLHPSLRDNEHARARFVREAEILYGLNHPHVVKVRNIRLDTELPYMEMEFVEGESLEDVLKRGALGARAVPLAIQLASALTYLHSRGIYHRDLKPANIQLEPDGGLKLVDFGLAVETDGDRITEAGTTFGTVSYAPPEWITPEKLTPGAWDMYALGVVMYEAFTGKVAFPMPAGGGVRQQIVSVMTAKQSARPLDPGDVAPWEVRELVGDLTRLDPDERPQSAAQVLMRLGEVVPGGIPGHLSIPHVLPPAPTETRSRRLPLVALVAMGLAGVALVGVLGGLGLAAVFLGDAPWGEDQVLVPPAPPDLAMAEPPTEEPIVEPPTEEPVTAPPVTAAPPVEGVRPPEDPTEAVISAPTDPVEPEPPPAPEPPTAAAATAGPLVSRAEFAAWVDAQPQWSRDSAIAAGQADENYLRPGALEGGGYVADVSWLAARAYCAGRGGLASVDAQPHEWADGQDQPFQEWRQHGGSLKWRRFDGESSDAARRTETNAFTGFRCAR